MNMYSLALYVAGLSAILTFLVSLRLIFKHLQNYSKPSIQKAIIRILLMAPIYAAASWLSLRFVRYSMYVDLIRDCYEAFVIYSFVEMLIQYSGGEKELLEALEKHPKMHHMFPFNFLHHFKTDRKFLYTCKKAVLQYVFIKPTMAALAIGLDELDLYEEGNFAWDAGYLYITVINNLSVTFAMYGLLYFYHAIQDHLASISPLKKLLCIKAVLFLSFWQGIVCAMLAKVNIVHATASLTLDQVETELQDFLLCFEMFFAAVAHDFAFSYTGFIPSSEKQKESVGKVSLGKKLKDVLSIGDLVADVKNTFFASGVDTKKRN